MAERPLNRTVSIENAKIIFRNFAGREERFNPKGRRTFCVLLTEEDAEMLAKDGWNVRALEPRDPEDQRQPYLQVAVSYSNIPPKVIMITSSNKTKLDEDSIEVLDTADIENVDLILRPYNWEVNGRTGVKAYLKSMYVTIAEDEFERKYRDVPSALNAFDEDDD